MSCVHVCQKFNENVMEQKYIALIEIILYYHVVVKVSNRTGLNIESFRLRIMPRYIDLLLGMDQLEILLVLNSRINSKMSSIYLLYSSISFSSKFLGVEPMGRELDFYASTEISGVMFLHFIAEGY